MIIRFGCVRAIKRKASDEGKSGGDLALCKNGIWCSRQVTKRIIARKTCLLSIGATRIVKRARARLEKEHQDHASATRSVALYTRGKDIPVQKDSNFLDAASRSR